MENFLVLNEHEARILFGCTDEEVDKARKSADGLIKRVKYTGVNDGTLPLYLSKKTAI